MNDHILKEIAILVIKVFIIINANNLGWNVEIRNNREIILTKPTRKLTAIDRDTQALMEILSGRLKLFK